MDPEDNSDLEDDKTPDPDAGAKTALDAERKARRDAEKQLKALRDQVKSLEDKDKSDGEKLTDRVAAAEKRAEEAESRAVRFDVASAKGLTAAQAKRLVGVTKEDLEADADEILEVFPAQGGVKPPPSSKPSADLKGGTDPTSEPEETDPRKLAAMHSRSGF